MHWHHKHNTHSFKPHCSIHNWEERKTHGSTWNTVLCTTRHECVMTGVQWHHAQSHCPFLNELLNVLIWHHMPSPSNWLAFQQHTVFDTHMTVPQPLRTSGCADIDNCWRNTPSHPPPHHPTVKPLPLFPFSTLTKHTLAWGYTVDLFVSAHTSKCKIEKNPLTANCKKFWLVIEKTIG